MKTPGSKERGFTLPELLIVIVLLGIMAAIAIPVWWGVVESRNVDSAANQVAADLRLAHTRASNRLETWTFEVDSTNPASYRIRSAGEVRDRSLPDGTRLSSGAVARVEFSSRGTATPFNGAGSQLATSPIEVTVSAADGGQPRAVEINRATSRVEVD
jgi:type IV fimbrial biogenesis protein FimT